MEYLKKCLSNLKLKLKTKTMNFNISKKQGIIIIAVTLILMIVASQITIPDGANDPLDLIDYTPEEQKQLDQNGAAWSKYGTEIESHQMAIAQLQAAQATLSAASEKIRQTARARIQPAPFQ